MNQNAKIFPTVRWTYKDESGREDSGLRHNLSSQIDDWWIEFVNNREEIIDHFLNQGSFDVQGFMLKNLQSIHPGLYWEYGPAIFKKGHRLVVTSETRKYIRPLVSEIIKRSPELADWEFYAYRLPEDVAMLGEIVKIRTGGNISQLKFKGSINEFNEIDLTFLKSGILTDREINQGYHEAFVAIESLLGEEVLDKWVGNIIIGRLEDHEGQVHEISELKIWFNHTIKQIQRKLNDQPYFQISRKSPWTTFELKPLQYEDYVRQEDMIVGRSMNSALWRNARNGNLFYSGRYSKFGELFCYIKIESSLPDDNDDLSKRTLIEKIIDEILINAQAGCVVGGGHGLAYTYIDLALTKFDKAIELIKYQLQKEMVSVRSWIMFYDSEMMTEWIGIWDESPAPPIPIFEEYW